MDGQTENVVTVNVTRMPVATSASGVKTPSESVSDSDDDFEDARDAISSSRAVDEERSNATGEDEDLSEDDVIVDFLGKSNEEAEARLAVRRQARAEAREIRMRELERQQKEAEENADRIYDMHPENALRTPPVRTGSSASGRTPVVNSTGGNNYQWSRRSSEDSLEDGATERGSNLRDNNLRHELKEADDKFRKAMIQNAQLDNEKASFTYQVELLKDRLEDLEVAHSQLQKEHKEKCRKSDQLKRLAARLKEDLDLCKAALEERDRLIQEQGLVIVGDEGEMDGCEDGDVDGDAQDVSKRKAPRKALVSIESAAMLQCAGEGSLDVRLRKFAEEKNELMDEIRHLKLELEEERSRHRNGPRTASGTINGGSDADMEDVQREANKLLGDYKFKLQKAEQDVSTLQANVARLESQVIRYKSAAETAEKVEDELKSERRRLQREDDGVKDTGTESSESEGNGRVRENGEQTDEPNCDFWAIISDDVPESGQKPVQQKDASYLGRESPSAAQGGLHLSLKEQKSVTSVQEEEEFDFWASISTETDIVPRRKSVMEDLESNRIEEENDQTEESGGPSQEINGQVAGMNDEAERINDEIGDINDEIDSIKEQIQDVNEELEKVKEDYMNGDETGDVNTTEDENDHSEDCNRTNQIENGSDDKDTSSLIDSASDEIEDRSDQIENRSERMDNSDQTGVESDDSDDERSGQIEVRIEGDQIENGSDHRDKSDQLGVESEDNDGERSDQTEVRIQGDQIEDSSDQIEDRSDQIEDRSDQIEDRSDQIDDRSDQIEDRSDQIDEDEEERSDETGLWSEREKSSDENRINGTDFSDSGKDESDDKTISEERLKSDSLSYYEETNDKPDAEESSDFHSDDSDDKSEIEDTFDDAERMSSADVENQNGIRRSDSVDFWNVLKASEEKCPLEYSVGFTLTKPKKKSISQESGTDGEDLTFVNDAGPRVDRS